MTVKTIKLNKLLVFIAITELAGLFGFLLGGSPKQSYAALAVFGCLGGALFANWHCRLFV